MKERLFVYGTLKKDTRTDEIVREDRLHFIGKGRIEGVLHDLGDYPAVVPTKGRFVHGEVYEISDPDYVLQKLDSYEEIDSSKPEAGLFVRRKAKVWIEDGTTIIAHVYFYNKPTNGLKIVEDGKWDNSTKKHRFGKSL